MKKWVKYLGLPFLAYFMYWIFASLGLFLVGPNYSVQLTCLIDFLMASVCITILHKCLSNWELGYVHRIIFDKNIFIWILLFGFVFIVGQCSGSAIYSLYGDSAFLNYSSEMTAAAGVLYILLSWIIAPIYEEVFFRGIIYRSIKQLFGPLVSSLIVSALFALSHGTIVHLIPTFLLSMLLCLIHEYTSDIKYCVAFHCLNNILTMSGASSIEYPDIFFDLKFDIVATGILVGIMVVLFMLPTFRSRVHVVDVVEKSEENSQNEDGLRTVELGDEYEIDDGVDV